MALCKSKLQNGKFRLNNKLKTISHEGSGSFQLNIANSNVFHKQRIFIDYTDYVEYDKLKSLLLKLKAEVLETFDENANYVILSNNKLNSQFNDNLSQSNSSTHSKISNMGSKTILKSRQLNKVLSTNVNNNGNKQELSNADKQNFILHVQKLKIPTLSSIEVFEWINLNHSYLIQEIEINSQNKIWDKNKMLKLISTPGLKIFDTQGIYAPDYMSNCNFDHFYFKEISRNNLNEKSGVEICETKTVTDFSKCQKSSKLLKPIVENVKKKKVKSDEKYCEYCDVKYKNVIAHIESAQHMEFANDTSKFIDINNIITSYPDFDAFNKIRIRKQKALERLESRKLIKQLSANDFKNEIVKSPEVMENLQCNELSINKTSLNIDIEGKSLSLETPETISEHKDDSTIEQEIVEPIKSNISILETKLIEVVDSSSTKMKNDNKTSFNESKENFKPSIFIEKIEFPIDKNHPKNDINPNSNVNNNEVNELSDKVTENSTTVQKTSKKSVKKKNSKSSLKLRKPCFARSIENLTESCDNLTGYNTHDATISECKLEYHNVEVSNTYFHATVINCLSEISTINTQEILPICEYQTCCKDISYDIITFDKTFIVNHLLFAPIDVLTEILGQCGKMKIPTFISLNPIDVTTLFNVATTMVVNPHITSSSNDISIVEKISFCRAGHVLNNLKFELVTASVQTITAVNNVEIEIVNNSATQNSDEESSLIMESAELNDSFGSSIEMLSACRYNVKLDTTSDGLQTPLSPITADYKHHAFSPFILRSANKSSVDHGFSPEFSISPPRYVSEKSFEFDTTPISKSVAKSKNDKIQKPNLLSSETCNHRNSKHSRNKHSTNSNKDDLILNLKQIVNQSDISEIKFFDRLSESKLTNSNQKFLFSVDSFVENYFLKQFDLNLSSDRKCLQEVTNQKAVDIDLKSKKRNQPETGFSSPDEYLHPLFGNLSRKQRRKIDSNSSGKYLFETPVARRPFRRAKYIARESISISTQLYLN